MIKSNDHVNISSLEGNIFRPSISTHSKSKPFYALTECLSSSLTSLSDLWPLENRHNLKIRSCEDGCITAFKRSGKIEIEKKIRLNSRVELITCTRNNKGPFCLVFLYKNRTHKGSVFE